MKIVNTYKTRQYLSNPFYGISHTTLLELANVKCFNDNYTIENLPNGRIIVKEKSNK